METVRLIKTKTTILTKFLAALAVVLLVIPAYADCKDRCRRLRLISCHKLTADRTEESANSACCHHTKPQSKNTTPEKCKGACCISNLPPSATTENQGTSLDIQNIPNVCENVTVAESDITLKTVIPSANLCPYPHNSTQAMLCVFVI